MAEDKTHDVHTESVNYENLCPVMFSTGQGYAAARDQSKKIAHFINNTTITVGLNILDVSGHNDPDVNTAEMMAMMQDTSSAYFPVVINLISAGRNGKDTFANMVVDNLPYRAEVVSCVSPAVEACRVFADQLYGLYQTTIPDIYIPVLSNAQIVNTKSDAYRQMLHDVKDAFSTFNNGPVLHAIGHYLKLADMSMQFANGAAEMKNGSAALFVNNRDIDTVETLQEWCYQMGVMWINVYVKGAHNSSEYHNSCDSNVDRILYDILIDNTGTIEELQHRASIFATLFTWALRLYGTPIREGNGLNGCILRGRNIHCQRVAKFQSDKLQTSQY